MIQDIKYRVSYYMVLALLFLATLNIYLSVVYYIHLRNMQGVQGVPGICSFSEKCGIENPRQMIIGVANSMYSDISIPCLDNPTLGNCNNNQDILDQARPINAQINMLEKIASTTTMAEADFKAKLDVCLIDSNSCMDPTDF